MPSCYQNCDLRTLLRAKETKINKLKQVLSDLNDLCFFESHRYQEVLTKMVIVREMIEKTLDEARDAVLQIVHGCEICHPTYQPAAYYTQEEEVPKPRSSKLTLSKETVSRPTIRQPHLMRTASKTEDECESNDANRLILSLPNAEYILRPTIYHLSLSIQITNNTLLRE